MFRVRQVAMSLLAAVSCASAFGGESAPRFASGPTARRDGRNITISFSVDAPTDVEVSVLDAGGKVVRHLAAGMMGKNSPAPLKPGLSQKIVWDGKDDDGKTVSGAKVRVSLGMRPEFDRVIGWSGQLARYACGITVGPDGTLYQVAAKKFYAHRRTWNVFAYSPEGKYLRQVFPGPANLPAEKRKGWPRVKLQDGSEVPVIFQLLSRSTYPGAVFCKRNFPVCTADGRLITLSGSGKTTVKHPDLRGGRRLMIIGTDGSVPENWLGPVVRPSIGGFGHIAVSPDDKYVYASGFVSTGRKGKGPENVVYRVALDGSEPSKVFIGEPFKTGESKAALNDPQGLATDKDGNIYVADYGKDRIAVFKPDGTYLDEIPCKHPDTVLVSRKTGAVYVLELRKRTKKYTDSHYYTPALNWAAARVAKFGGLKNKAEKASHVLKRKGYGGGAFLALDESGTQPRLWLTGLSYQGSKTYGLKDLGNKLEWSGELGGQLSGDKAGAARTVSDAAVVGNKMLIEHPASGQRTHLSKSYDLETGKYLGHYTPVRANGKKEKFYTFRYGEMYAGQDGLLYSRAQEHKVLRYDIAGKPVPFESTGKCFVKFLYHSHTRGPGMFVDRKGRMYVPSETVDFEKLAAMSDAEFKKLRYGRRLVNMTVPVVGPDGKIINPAAVKTYNARLGGIAVDSRGNIYLGAHVMRKGERLLPELKKLLPKDGPAHHPSNDYMALASVIKFPPTGGEVCSDPKGDHVAAAQGGARPVSLKNSLWSKRMGYVGTHGRELGCHCESSRFDIDRHDRLFVPDVFRFRVYVLDSSGNEITHFGSYGNMDSRGPGSPVPEPRIPFGWPLSAECAGSRVVVGDLTNERVVSVKIGFATSREVAIR